MGWWPVLLQRCGSLKRLWCGHLEFLNNLVFELVLCRRNLMGQWNMYMSRGDTSGIFVCSHELRSISMASSKQQEHGSTELATQHLHTFPQWSGGWRDLKLEPRAKRPGLVRNVSNNGRNHRSSNSSSGERRGLRACSGRTASLSISRAHPYSICTNVNAHLKH